LGELKSLGDVLTKRSHLDLALEDIETDPDPEDVERGPHPEDFERDSDEMGNLLGHVELTSLGLCCIPRFMVRGSPIPVRN